MSRYVLKTFYNHKEIERFEHRTKEKLTSILSHPRMNRAGELDPWGNSEPHPNRFEITDAIGFKLFEGNLSQTEAFVRTLR
jgi:hypothetical protein